MTTIPTKVTIMAIMHIDRHACSQSAHAYKHRRHHCLSVHQPRIIKRSFSLQSLVYRENSTAISKISDLYSAISENILFLFAFLNILLASESKQMCVVNPNKTEELTYFRSSHTRFYHHGRHSDRADVSKIVTTDQKGENNMFGT